ncbi:MAG: 23S rRNA (guanosine(2251)-2'-O)-methyltransferase RlmB [Deltaproteobacteria bacterium]|nr:23S rRNA (guanosine(2251)-2'-O)-methyltransferase RlmB [Deltaproteobacteria bacterium]
MDKGKNLHLIPGFHSVKEVLVKGRIRIDELWIAKGKTSARGKEIIRLAEEKGIRVHYGKGAELDNLLPGMAHQGVVALTEKFSYIDLDDLINSALSRSGHGLLIAADHITDEGNLGALIRTASFLGAHGLILPKDRSAKVTEGVIKRSSGAYIHLPIARAVNLGRTLDILNERGFWIIGAEGESPDSIFQFDWDRDLVLIMGSEDKGLSHPVKKRCHQVVSIPSSGCLKSLNVSVAAGIILAEIFRQRSLRKKI